jgi:hypothetical protein
MPMNNSCTINDLVLYLYNETELSQSVVVQNAIDTDFEVSETFDSLKYAKRLIESSLIAPPAFLKEGIMNHARITAPL